MKIHHLGTKMGKMEQSKQEAIYLNINNKCSLVKPDEG